jgi:hypothetical protein
MNENDDYEEEPRLLFYYEVAERFTTFTEYSRAFEDFIEHQIAEIRTRHPDIETNIWATLETNFDSVTQYPTVLRESLFTAICSFAEGELNGICDWERKERNLTLAPRDLTGQGIERARNYLVKVVGINPTEPEWEGLANYQKLRNCLVHSQGDLAECKNARYLRETYIPTQKYLSLSGNRVILERGFCEEVIANIHVFFEKLEIELSRTSG